MRPQQRDGKPTVPSLTSKNITDLGPSAPENSSREALKDTHPPTHQAGGGCWRQDVAGVSSGLLKVTDRNVYFRSLGDRDHVCW